MLADTISSLDYVEMIHGRAHLKSKELVELATLEWVASFNGERVPKPIGYIHPAETNANRSRPSKN